jgi:hypothetical protein
LLNYYANREWYVVNGPSFFVDGNLDIILNATVGGVPNQRIVIANFRLDEIKGTCTKDDLTYTEGMEDWPCYVTITPTGSQVGYFEYLGVLHKITVHGFYHNYPSGQVNSFTVQPPCQGIVVDLWATISLP